MKTEEETRRRTIGCSAAALHPNNFWVLKHTPERISICVTSRGGEEASGETGGPGEGERKEAGHRGRCSRDATGAMEKGSGTRFERSERPHQQGHVSRFSSKLCREEVEQFRREVDMLKSKLMRHEEDMYQQQSEARETRKQCERNCKALETVIDSYRAHDFELSRIISQYHHTQQDVRDVRLAVSGLKDEVRSLILRDRLNTPAEMQQKSNPLEAAVAVETSPLRQMLSDSDDELSPTPSLRDVSSDDLDTSWLGESASKPRSQGRVTHFSLSGSDLSDAVSGLGSNHDDVDGKVGGASDSAPELSLCDL
ncbi:uncharacterized protein LOC132883644 isoform X3 [Neoarius graeffei]|uniref:uncharacterized protein LOC132883644 isoform X3 n=1 Tax=Neoarius graeffei TaxID=443677 RepID=UPI00298CF48D|nr:uncharacterized protein LOC132883644 isoform X3 [Neoarius graeffei]